MNSVFAATALGLALSFAAPAPALGGSLAAKPVKPRYYAEVELVSDKTKGGKELGNQVKTAVEGEISKLPEMVIAKADDGAPKDVKSRAAWLEKKGLIGIAIQVTIMKRVEKKVPAGINIDFTIKTVLITRPGGWMVLSTRGLSEGEGRSRKGVLESVVLGAAAGATEDLINHLRAKPIKPTEPAPKHTALGSGLAVFQGAGGTKH